MGIIALSLAGAYAMARVTMLAIIAIAALIAGMRIYQNTLKGEEFEGPVIRWIIGLVVAISFFAALESFTAGDIGTISRMPHFMALTYSAEMHQAALVFGFLLAVLAIYKIYKKFRDGEEDVYDYLITWLGSLIFLFMMGWIIDSVLGNG